MKRIFILTALILIMATTGCGRTESQGHSSIQSYKDIPGITRAEISAVEALIADHGSFTYGHLLETESFMLPDGTFAGFTINVCGLLSELFGAEFVPLYCDEWETLRSGIDNHVIDFTGCLTPTTERLEAYSMTEPIAGRSLKIYMLRDSAEIKTESDLNGLRVGFLSGAVTKETVMNRYADLSFEAVEVYSFYGAVEKLESGVIDVFVIDGVSDPHFEAYDFIRSMDLFQPIYTPVSIATGDPELAPIISVIDKYLDAGGIDKIYELYDEGKNEYTRHRLYQSFTDEEMAYISAFQDRETSATVSVAFESDNYPISFYNTVDKEFQGIALDVLAEISELTGIKFTTATDKDSTWAEIYEKAKTGEISMIDQLLYSDARNEYFIWSAPYARSYYALISRLDYPNLDPSQVTRATVGALSESAAKDIFYETFPNHTNIRDYDTQYECLDALESGEIDLLMASEYMLLTQTNYREKPGFKVNLTFSAPMSSSFGFNKNEYVLRSIIDKAQEYVNTDAIVLNWTGRVFDYSKKISQMQTVYVLVFAGILVLVLIRMGFMSRKNSRLSKSLEERTAALTAIYASIPDTVFSKSIEGVYTSCNPSFEKQAGMSEAELIGKTYAEVFAARVSGTVELYRGIDEKVTGSRAAETVEETVIYPDGSRRILETVKAPLIQNGNVVGLLGIGRDVTERREIETRFNRIINTVQIAYILTIDGIITELNEYGRKHIGMKLGDDIRPFYSDPEQRDEIIKMIGQHEPTSNIIVRYRMADGSVHRFLSSCTAVEYGQRQAYVQWALDIEQDELKNDQLRVTRQSLQTVLDTLPMPVRIVDLESYRIIYVNDSLLELLEYDSAGEICGRKLSEIMPEFMSDGTPASERIDLIMNAEDPVSVEIEYCAKTGRVIEAVVATRLIDYKDRRSSIGIIKDLTAEKEQARILINAMEREKEANQAQSRFLANMSHEIRTPMNGIIGMADLLLGEDISGRQLQYAKDIKMSAESLLGIINDILDLSKITEGKLQIMPVGIDLSALLKNIASLMSFSARSKGLDFVDDIQLDFPEYVCADDIRLKQVLVNLLSNAIKFTKTGYVKLAAKIGGGNIEFAVSDTGIGIRQEDIHLIFAPFEQADKRRNRNIKGTGLGLAISGNLVELMGGKIWVESEYGAGTTFYVTIPHVPADSSTVEAAETEIEYIFAPKAQVLLVDDIQTNLTVGAGLLRLCGIAADTALSGQDAIRLVQAKDYDIVFMDHMMPEMDGIETTERIRGISGKYRELPIIALTANAMNEAKDLLLASGMSDFLSKPIDKGALIGLLQKWLPAHKIEARLGASTVERSGEYSAVLDAAAKIDGLDIELALGRIGGMQAVLEASLRQVADSIRGKLKIMDGHLSKGNMRDFAIEAHGLKAALANIGATHNSELAAELEMAAKVENIPLCVDKFSVFASIMEGLADELKSAFPRAETGGRRGGDELLARGAGEAIDCLESFEAADALERLSALDGFTFGEATDAALNDAKSAVRAFDYDKAVSLLRSIVK